MSWDERLFGWGLKIYESVVSSRTLPTLEEQNQIKLEDLTFRLKILASALLTETIEIKEAETIGGLYGSTLLLPRTMAAGPTPELNEGAYLFRVIYAAVVRQINLVLPPEVGDSSEGQFLFSILAAPAVLAQIERQFPNAKETMDHLIYHELQRQKLIPGEIKSQSEVFTYIVRALLSKNEPAGHPPEEFRNIKTIKSMEINRTFTDLWPHFRRLPGGGRALAFPSFLGLIYDSAPEAESKLGESGSVPVSQGSLASGTERKAKAKEKIREIKFEKDKDGENPIVHAFEKLRTAADYTGGRKSLDGGDELDEHLEALEELDLRNVIRTHERTDSVYKADVMLEANVADLAEEDSVEAAQFSYDEWDESKRVYKKNWCRVFASYAVASLPSHQAAEYIQQALAKHQRQTRELRQMFDEIKSERRWRNRQLDGPEIDLDAVVDRYAAVRSGSTPKDKLYLARRKTEKDYATLVLLDSSLSTDSWIDNRRVMDVLKESMLVISEVIPPERIAIGAFYSNTRKDCRYIEVKKFEEEWRPAKNRLVALKPTGYTRIGPALRHGTFLLSQVPAKKKLLLLISDGKPTDFDKYEGRYGIGDIRQAMKEASALKVMTRALAVDVNAKFYLPQMFGPGNFQILPHPGMLSKSLAEVYSWLMVR